MSKTPTEKEKLSSIYYQPTHLWIGNEAIEKLVELSGLSMKKVKIYLAHQAFWQVHIPGPKVVKHPHYTVTVPNAVHQFDLLSMPHDSLYGSKYKYILTGIDIASRFKVARPLRTKKAAEVAKMIEDIYKIVDQMNNTKTAGIKMKPNDAVKLDEVPQEASYKPDKKPLAEDGLYRYLVQPGEEHGDQRRRATDMIWSKKTFRLDRIVNEPNNRTMYYLAGAPERVFVKEELLRVPEDTKLPPDSVKKW